MTLHVRLKTGYAKDSAFIQRELHALNPALPPARVRPLRERIEEGYSALRLGMTVLVGLGATALLLSAIGLYGLTTYVVGQRTYEIGVRRVLGAGGLAILLLVVEDTLWLVAIGAACGLGLAALAGYAMHVVLRTVPDPAVFFGSAVVLVVSALLAAYLPARRAIEVDPLAALRCE
jgi:ABC-type antimicrobial peptide transport system permease subunit